MLDLAAVVAGGKDDKAADHRAGLLAVLVQSCIGIEVIDRLDIRSRCGLLIVDEAPAAVDQDGSVVGRIHEGCRSEGTVLAVEGLGDHQSYA